MGKLTNLSVVRNAVSEANFYFKKDLGQNFLIDSNIAESIAGACLEDDPDTVLEIGPGLGALTELLCESGKEIIAAEIDPFAVRMLTKFLGEAPNLTIVHSDIMKTDLSEILKDSAGRICAVSNLPYNLTSPIIIKLLESEAGFVSMTLMMQKEVAERITSEISSKNTSAFGLIVSWYAQAEFLFSVSKNVFYPSPKVDSAVIKLRSRSAPPVEVIDRSFLFKTIKAGFAMRRKQLINCIASAFAMNKQTASDILIQSEINPQARAETLSLAQFAVLSDNLYLHLNHK